jgi:hypothetical protein
MSKTGAQSTPASVVLPWRCGVNFIQPSFATGLYICINSRTSTKMVCGKCAKLSKSTTLATPAVKKKSEMYYGSPAGSSKSSDKTKTSATLGNNGIGKASYLSALIYEDPAHSNIEQVTIESREKSVCFILEFLHHLQDQGGSRADILSKVRI